MDKFLTFFILGVSLAGIYAISASGLVVTYTTSGIFNFAHGATGMLGAFLFWQFHVDWGWNTWVSLLLVVGVAAPLYGIVVERVIMRNLTGASEAVRLVVTVSLLLMLLGIAQVVWPGNVTRPANDFFAGRFVKVASVNVSYHRIIILITAALVALVLRVILYRTRAGIAMRAVVDDRSLLRLNGGRPHRSSAMAWAIGSSLAAIAGILVAPTVGLRHIDLTFMVVNAFAAAVVGRLKSLPFAFGGALLLGLTEAFATGYLAGGRRVGGFALDNIRFAISPLLLFVVMVLMPQERLRTGAVQRVREHWDVPTWRTALLGIGALVVGVVAIVDLVHADTDLTLLLPAAFMALLALSLVPLTGWGGQVSLAQLTFAGFGGVVMSVVGTQHVLLGLVAAVVVSALLGALVALPALRLSGVYLALATAAFALVASRTFFNQQKVMPAGQRQIPALEIGPVKFESNSAQLLLLTVVTALVGLGLVALRRSAFGRRLTAMKDSPVACATLGLNLTRTKITVFALSAGIAGLAGALWSRTIQSTTFELAESMSLTMLAVVGGVGAIGGAYFGGVLMGGFSGLFPAIFGSNALGFFKFVELKVRDLLQVAPGFAGVGLGQNPAGAVTQIGDGFRGTTTSNRVLPVMIGVPLLGWALAHFEVIGNWTLIAFLVMFFIGLLPLLPNVLHPKAGSRPIPSLVLGVAALVGVSLIDWSTFVESLGWRVLIMGLLAFGVGIVLTVVDGGIDVPALIGDPFESPDLMGVHEPFRAWQLADAEAALGLKPEELNIVGSRQ
jgi:branched-chain amino acid transport system permease protein